MSWKEVHERNVHISRIRRWNKGSIGHIKAKTQEETDLIGKLNREAKLSKSHLRNLIFKILRERYN